MIEIESQVKKWGNSLGIITPIELPILVAFNTVILTPHISL